MIDARLYNIILAPVVTEKAARVTDKFKQFVFKVVKDANKCEVESAVRKIFGVNVLSVNTVNTKGKKKIFKQRQGKRSNTKKAYVTIQADQDIDFTKLQ